MRTRQTKRSFYTLNASDADLDALTYSLPANNNYYIDGNQIKVKAGADLDFESANNGTQLLVVTVSDGTKTSTATITIKLKNINDNAPILTNDTKTIDENTADETVVYTLNASDADLDALTYSLPANNNYYIDGNQIKVKADADLDFESANNGTQLLVVTVSDGTKTSTGTITIKLKNSNDNAPILKNDTKTIDENTADETVVYTLNASDADLDALTYSLPGKQQLTISTESSNCCLQEENKSKHQDLHPKHLMYKRPFRLPCSHQLFWYRLLEPERCR